MFRRSACLGLAVAATLATAGAARAQSRDVLTLNQPVYLADESRTPLMSMLDKAGVGSSLDSAGIKVTGYVEGGWTYNFDRPNNQTNVAHVFDFEDQDKTLNQIELKIAKDVDSSKAFDWGFTVEGIWGGDARLIHANGLNFYGSGNADVGGQLDGPDEQFDIVQANATLGFGKFSITAGKFVTLMGYEYINPTQNPFYSRSILFGFAIPFTQTGGYGKLALGDNLTLTLGFSRGWEQSPEDNNGAIDGFGQVAWTDGNKLAFAVTGSVGPQTAGDTGHYRTVIDVVGTYKLGDNTTLGLNADYGYGSDESADDPGDTGQWYGAAIYVSHKIDPHITLNARGEWFNDDDGARGLNTTVCEITLGATIHPMPENAWASGLMIRPEIRWDHANDNIFNDGNDENQFTVGGDIIFAF